MPTKIWERYFLREFAKIFFLFIIGFCFLYVLIDYSIHSNSFNRTNFSIFEFICYYLFHFIKRAEILITFALILSTIKVLCSLSLNNELVALLTSGVTAKELLRPFLLIATVCMCFLYLNFEFLTPGALSTLEEFKNSRLSEKIESKSKEKIQQLNLSDDSTIIYQKYDPNLQAFFDIYWIRSQDQIFRMRYLFPHIEQPVGRFVDHLIRNTEGKLVLFESFEETTFTDMRFDPELLRAALSPPEQQSLSQLWRHLPLGKKHLTDKEAQVLTAFSYKTAIPWVCLLAVIAPAPFCMVFTRNLRIFLIYSIGIFTFVAFFTIMDAATVLAENQVASPLSIIWSPMLLFGSIVYWLYARMR
ncbi:MAG: lipopolysaccharide export system permease protein [Chlamydiales bacterium]|jgi:lipopolysaccharide export system permease protein